MTRTALLLCLGALACKDKEGGGSDSGDVPDGGGGGDTQQETGSSDCEGSAGGVLAEGLVELSWDDDEKLSSSVELQSWTVLDEELATVSLNQSVRFELDHPARVWGMAVELHNLPSDPAVLVEMGLYPDLGYNGFDFWPDEAWWTGTRCAGDFSELNWATYAFETPIEFDHPALVYVVQHREEGDPSLGFDLTPTNSDGSCTDWDDCHSSMNLPELTDYTHGGYSYSAWNGVSFQFQYDYRVRLYVEYTDGLDPADTVFQLAEGVTPSNRASWGDYDDDGWDDLFSAGSLYHNTGKGFEDTTSSSGIGGMGIASSGGVWGDFDNDGCLDLFSFAESYTEADQLLHNECDGTFTKVTESSGIVDEQSDNDCDGGETYIRSPTPAAAWVDLDEDGLLDLYLSNFICWTDYSYYVDTVWHNEGDGTFSEWTADHGFSSSKRAGRGVNPIDHDQDGDVDILVNNYVLQANLFFENLGDGTFDEAASDFGLDGDGTSFGGTTYYGHTIGTAWGDLDQDGDFDSIQANLAHPRYFDFSDKTQVLLQGDDGVYTDVSGEPTPTGTAAGLRYQETHSVPVLGDFDNDGILDLSISAVYDGRPTDFYWGLGDGTFELDSYHAGITTESGWGMAASDYDLDGDLDLAVYGNLFDHQGFDAQGEALGHWLSLRLVGNVSSNHAAIGATARVEAGDQTWLRYVPGGTGQGNQDSLYLHIGLGSVSSVDAVEVDFPGGDTVRYEGPFDADQRLWLYEDGSTWAGLHP